jgi:hypothetical protein
LNLLDADAAALAAFEAREGAAGREIVAVWRGQLERHRQAARAMHEAGGFPNGQFLKIQELLL